VGEARGAATTEVTVPMTVIAIVPVVEERSRKATGRRRKRSGLCLRLMEEATLKPMQSVEVPALVLALVVQPQKSGVGLGSRRG